MRVEVVHGRHDFGPPRLCSVCAGTGVIYQLTEDPRMVTANPLDPAGYRTITCPTCDGTGSYVWANAYTYDCPWPVSLGDFVVVPPNDAHPEQEATVVRLGSSYLDPVQTVLGVIPKDQA